jgi:hypothetical protein
MKIPALYPEISQQMAMVHQPLGDHVLHFVLALPDPINRQKP